MTPDMNALVDADRWPRQPPPHWSQHS